MSIRHIWAGSWILLGAGGIVMLTAVIAGLGLNRALAQPAALPATGPKVPAEA